jgi:hypothetical protein
VFDDGGAVVGAVVGLAVPPMVQAVRVKSSIRPTRSACQVKRFERIIGPTPFLIAGQRHCGPSNATAMPAHEIT